MYLILSLSMRQYATSKITSSTLYTIRSEGQMSFRVGLHLLKENKRRNWILD